MENLFNLAQVGKITEAQASLSILLVLLWTIPWKGYALWVASKRSQKWWFIALLLINTLAIFEIFYIFFIAKKKNEIFGFFKKILRIK